MQSICSYNILSILRTLVYCYPSPSRNSGGLLLPVVPVAPFVTLLAPHPSSGEICLLSIGVSVRLQPYRMSQCSIVATWYGGYAALATAGLGVVDNDDPARDIGTLFTRRLGMQAVKNSFVMCTLRGIPGNCHKRQRQTGWFASGGQWCNVNVNDRQFHVSGRTRPGFACINLYSTSTSD